MATKQDYAQTMNKEMQQILDHAKALVDATSGMGDPGPVFGVAS
ncbi:hypothetical protein [Megalodesulfovibrio gigas]|uniref:Uncharacterized protein n=1 Tax=Megalodesulfovibrio gigas (strain ATCC 19364 / DSM 1382 / NCIMB 9332 / VKM B-1759) TaxID=1121448 RepID=T2GFX8_MEGG1|nr:hypothetical protein [Megalodesulfovibrio gigas]AGW15051.1 hypothetical protein DGI_3360 [Megalodesulfovibrio gigas DSM 1382 = ATCC 19364]